VDEKLVSVVIPSFNHRAFVGAAIESVLAQSYSPIELIVVDDGSTDGSPEWIEQNYSGKIKKMVDAPHRGAHAAINEGIQNARGTYTAILNSDDVYAPERIAKLVGAAESGDFDVVFSDVEFIDDTGKPAPRHKSAVGYRKALEKLAPLPIEEALLRQNFTIASSNLLVRREVFDRIGVFRGFKLCHDWDFLLRCIGRAKIGRVVEPLLDYRLHRGNTISNAEPWLASAECALVYLSYFLERAGPSAPADFLLDAEPFEPLAIGWMLAEARRIGLDRLIAEAETGTLHRRLQADFERNGFGFAARLSPRRIKKKITGGLRAWLK
jgi:glycosyltransferase involved in cell wall biosynthesis